MEDEEAELRVPAMQKEQMDGLDADIDISSTLAGVVVTKHNCNSKINTLALNGLRGLISIHIMLFHSFGALPGKLSFSILGSVPLTLFFAISGFILALKEGQIEYKEEKLFCCCNCNNKNKNNQSINLNKNCFDKINFYQRRIARILPLYYIVNILFIPLIYIDKNSLYTSYHFHNNDDDDLLYQYLSYILTIFMATTWLFYPFVIVYISWFVSTIWFLYLLFPYLLTNLQYLSSNKQYSLMKKLYWIQLILIHCFGYIIYFSFNNNQYYGYVFSSFQPVTRIPIFMMGILAGLLRLQNSNIFYISDNSNTNNNTNSNTNSSNNSNNTNEELEYYRKKCVFYGIGYIMILIIGIIIENNTIEYGLLSCNYMFQMLLAWWMVKFIYILTKIEDNDSNIISKFFTSKVLLFFGRISYALYLIHYPIILYVAYISVEIFNMEKYPCLPLVCLPFVWILVILMAFILNRLIEEPGRKCLRPSP